MRIVVALGRKALNGHRARSLPGEIAPGIRSVVEALAPICMQNHQVVITHGNGPQAGWLALQSAATPNHPYAFDGIDAGDIGMVGYLIEQQLSNALPRHMVLAAILTQTRVDRHDPSFLRPSFPIGPVYGESEARLLAAERGWRVAPCGTGWRRVVASPQPCEVLEGRVVETLIEGGVIVICAGGGGVPVITLEEGGLASVEAVVENDAASALLARQIRADWLLLLTDVDGVYPDWVGMGSKRVTHSTPAGLAGLSFGAGSMLPKVEAACRFVNETGKRAGIGRVSDIAGILAGEAGTIVSAEVVH